MSVVRFIVEFFQARRNIDKVRNVRPMQWDFQKYPCAPKIVQLDTQPMEYVPFSEELAIASNTANTVMEMPYFVQPRCFLKQVCQTIIQAAVLSHPNGKVIQEGLGREFVLGRRSEGRIPAKQQK